MSPSLPPVTVTALRSSQQHPFLLLLKSDYPRLQALAQISPGREIRDRAIALAGGSIGGSSPEPLAYDPGAFIRARGARLAEIFSTAALAYVLDPPQRGRYVRRIATHLKYWDPTEPGNLTAELNHQNWNYSTTPAGAFFNAILALDIIHDELPPKDLAQIEGWLHDGPGKFFEGAIAWKSSGYAVRGAWALYQRDLANAAHYTHAYLAELWDSISPDGVFREGPGYALARWMDYSREQKHYFGDILAHTGVCPSWYSEDRLQKLQEWLYGYSLTPNRIPWAIGDSSPGPFDGPHDWVDYPSIATTGKSDVTGFERASRFSAKAGQYAAWFADGRLPAARLCSYVLWDRTAQARPAIAPSKIFPDGGAWFREPHDDPRALAGILTNVRHGRGHTHKETNTLNLAGYGETLLSNAGYNGWATPACGFSWEYINRRAISGNTALIDYNPFRDGGTLQQPSAFNDHRDPSGPQAPEGAYGAGVSGFTTGTVDYATGDRARPWSTGSTSATS